MTQIEGLKFEKIRDTRRFFFDHLPLDCSVCLRVMGISSIEKEISQCVQQWVLMQVMTPSELFSWIFRRKLSKHRSLQDLSTVATTFHHVVQTVKVIWIS